MTEPVRLRPEIAALPPYRQGRQAAPDAFKLSSNENPLEPLPAVLDALRDSLAVNRYPDGAAVRLRSALAERLGVEIDEIHVGAGSLSLLSQLLHATALPGDEVVYPWRSFEAYPGLVTVTGATGVPIPNRPDGGHDLDAMAAAISERTAAVIVCSPNNPTGEIVTSAEFEDFMAKVPETLLVILDEAYHEFVTDDSAVNGVFLTERYPNLVVVRTFSKAYGLAGLRIGYAVGAAYLLDAARSTALALSVTELAQEAALVSLAHEPELLERVDGIVALREHVRDALVEQGWNVPRALGNFVWLPTGEHTAHASEVFERHGVVVRAFVPEGLRVTIGEAASVEKLLAAAQEVVRTL